jgi:hypothetical protein
VFGNDKFKRLRAIIRNAIVWGVGWGALGFVTLMGLRLFGVLPRDSVLDDVGMAVRIGFMGAIAGVAFSTLIRFLYRGRRLSEISAVRFGILGGVATGLFVPALMQTMNVLTGGKLLPLSLITDDIIISTVFGGVIAGVTMKLAQRGDALYRRGAVNELDVATRGDQLPPAEERPAPIANRSRSTPGSR